MSQDRFVEVHICPSLLHPDEPLRWGGGNDEKITVTEPSILAWVDLEPEMRFAHRTCAVLIGAKKVQVLPGSWWLVLGDGLRFPELRVPSGSVVFPVDVGSARAHLLPRPILPEDHLSDGADGPLLPVRGASVVLYVDLDPLGRFDCAVRSRYVLLSASGVQVIDGKRKPVLRGSHQPLGIGVAAPTRQALAVPVLPPRTLQLFEGTPSDGDPFEIESCRLEGDELVAEVRYAGGCAQHDFQLLWNGAFMKSLPPQASFRLVHHANGDACESSVRETVRFSLSELEPCVMHVATAFGFQLALRHRLGQGS